MCCCGAEAVALMRWNCRCYRPLLGVAHHSSIFFLVLAACGPGNDVGVPGRPLKLWRTLIVSICIARVSPPNISCPRYRVFYRFPPCTTCCSTLSLFAVAVHCRCPLPPPAARVLYHFGLIFNPHLLFLCHARTELSLFSKKLLKCSNLNTSCC